MRAAVLIHAELPFNHRVQRLLKEYAHFPQEQLEEALRKIERRMGGQHVKAALEAFQAGDLATATGIALEYYDKTYTHATSKGNFSQKIHFEPAILNSRNIAESLIELANDNRL
jgi:tRNA 2-selenouridine synthase